MDFAWLVVLLALATALAAGLAALHWRSRARRAQREAAAGRRHLLEVLDAVDIGLLLCDRDDRLRLWNADYARMFPDVAAQLREGLPFESLLRAVVAAGGVPEAAGDEAGWIARRMEMHRRPGAPMLRRMGDGRWRRITERYLSDGGMVCYSHDVTDLVGQGEALQRAQEAAERAIARLEDAIEVLPAAFELYDADDRVVLANRRMRELFPLVSPLADAGATFEEIVREHARLGGLAGLPLPPEQWIAKRVAERARADGRPAVWRSGERWMRVYEQRTRDGGLVGVRLDITDEVEQRQAAERADQRLRDAIEALPDGFAMYDPDDRLVVCNERYRTLYRESAPAMRPGTRFEDILRYGLERGQYPQAAGREEAWLAERLRAHREPGPPLLQELPGNRWLRIDERRTPDGSLVGVRADVTALVRREQAVGGAA